MASRSGGRTRIWYVSPAHVGGLSFVTVALFASLVAGGCSSLLGGGRDGFNVDQGEVAAFALPSTRTLSHAADSLVHLQIEEKDGKLDFQLSKSYRALIVEWTSARPGRAGVYFRTHATLWSKELSLASLIPERGVQTLSKDLARDMIEERVAEYDSVVQIDVYVFAPSIRALSLSALQLDSPGRRVYLRDEEDTQYEPTSIESQAPLQAFNAGRQALYGRNAVFFDRYTDDGDDLLDAERLRLYVRPGQSFFTWVFPRKDPPVGAATSGAQ